MTEAEFDRRVRGMEGRMYRTARAMLKNEFDCADAMQNAVFGSCLPCGTKRGSRRG